MIRDPGCDGCMVHRPDRRHQAQQQFIFLELGWDDLECPCGQMLSLLDAVESNKLSSESVAFG